MPTKIEQSPVGPPATSDEFFEAIAAGNSEAAADALRRMSGLGPQDLQLLADLFSGDPVCANLFPYRIELKKGADRPTDPMRKKADAFRFVRLIRRNHPIAVALRSLG